MARKKKHSKSVTKRHHSGRRMGAVNQGITADLGEAAGLVLGSLAATVVQRQFTSMNPKVVSGAQLVGAIILKRHVKSPLMNGVVYGVMSAGAIGLVHQFGIIHGIEDVVSGMISAPPEDMERMHGINNNLRVSGLNNNARISMVEEDAEADDRMRPVGW